RCCGRGDDGAGWFKDQELQRQRAAQHEIGALAVVFQCLAPLLPVSARALERFFDGLGRQDFKLISSSRIAQHNRRHFACAKTNANRDAAIVLIVLASVVCMKRVAAGFENYSVAVAMHDVRFSTGIIEGWHCFHAEADLATLAAKSAHDAVFGIYVLPVAALFITWMDGHEISYGEHALGSVEGGFQDVSAFDVAALRELQAVGLDRAITAALVVEQT